MRLKKNAPLARDELRMNNELFVKSHDFLF